MSLDDLDIKNIDEIIQEQAPQPPAPEQGMQQGGAPPQGGGVPTLPPAGQPSPDQMMQAMQGGAGAQGGFSGGF